VYFPGFLWLACGCLNGLNAAKCNVLKGRQVVLFPDLGAHDKWQDKARELSPVAPLMVSAFLEKRATNEEKEQGLDLADYLLEFPVSAFPLNYTPVTDKKTTSKH
jgi:hypothetical protein